MVEQLGNHLMSCLGIPLHPAIHDLETVTQAPAAAAGPEPTDPSSATQDPTPAAPASLLLPTFGLPNGRASGLPFVSVRQIRQAKRRVNPWAFSTMAVVAGSIPSRVNPSQ